MRRPRSAALAAALVLAGLACGRRGGSEQGAATDDQGEDPASAALAPVVETRQGPVRGTRDGRAEVFRGLPYAAPPLGSRRFAPPEPPPTWAEIRDASEFGPRCPQPSLLGGAIGDEDCLTLNLWRPVAGDAGPDPKPWPVLVFIHGGANVIGSGSDPLLNGRRLAAEHGLIVVTFNYRLGLLGFLAHPALRTPGGGSGNWAHLDQIAALDWIAANVAAFGGDPSRVTIVGESAGAASVCVLLASPRARGRFAAAILQSGGCDVAPRATREAQGQRVLAASACADANDPAACLRALPSAELVGLGGLGGLGDLSRWQLPIGGAVDGELLPASPRYLLAAGDHARVPVLVGSNADETALFTAAELRSCSDYEQAIRRSFALEADAVLAEYPCSAFVDGRAAYVRVTTDAVFGCQARRILRALGESGTDAHSYRYYYAHTRGDPAVAELGAFHGGELQLLFGTHTRLGYRVSAAEQAVAAAIQRSWAGLARVGSPVHPGTPGWEPWDPSRDNALVLGDPITVADGIGTEHCEFWDARAEPLAQPATGSPVGQATPVPPIPQ